MSQISLHALNRCTLVRKHWTVKEVTFLHHVMSEYLSLATHFWLFFFLLKILSI